MPKSTQARLLGIREKTTTMHPYACFSQTYWCRLIYSRHAILGVFLTCMLEKFMFSLSVIFFLLLLIIYDPQKASVGMYSGCDYLLSLKSCLRTLWHCHPYFIFQFYSIVFILVSVLFYCMSATIYSMGGAEVRACTWKGSDTPC